MVGLTFFLYNEGVKYVDNYNFCFHVKPTCFTYITPLLTCILSLFSTVLLCCTRKILFEDGNHLYRFLDDDPIVSQCQNIPRGIIDVKPKPILEIASRLRFLSFAILEAYVSEDGKHVDYRSIHGSEEFARFLFSFLFLLNDF